MQMEPVSKPITTLLQKSPGIIRICRCWGHVKDVGCGEVGAWQNCKVTCKMRGDVRRRSVSRLLYYDHGPKGTHTLESFFGKLLSKVTFERKFCVCQGNFRKFSTFESIFRKLEHVLFLKVFVRKRSAVIG